MSHLLPPLEEASADMYVIKHPRPADPNEFELCEDNDPELWVGLKPLSSGGNRLVTRSLSEYKKFKFG